MIKKCFKRILYLNNSIYNLSPTKKLMRIQGSFKIKVYNSLFYFTSKKSFSDDNTLNSNKYTFKDESEFINKSSEFLDKLSEKIEILGLDQLDIEYVGVLKVSFLKTQQYYVINLQKPSLQIWFSSPISGPQRFEYDVNATWINTRNNKNMLQILENEWNDILYKNYEINKQIVLK